MNEVSSNGQALKSANIWAVNPPNSIGTGHPKRVIISGVDEQIECVQMIQVPDTTTECIQMTRSQGITDLAKLMTQNDPDTTTFYCKFWGSLKPLVIHHTNLLSVLHL